MGGPVIQRVGWVVWWVGLFSKGWLGGLLGGAVVQRVGLVGRAVFKRLSGWVGGRSCCSKGWVGG